MVGSLSTGGYPISRISNGQRFWTWLQVSFPRVLRWCSGPVIFSTVLRRLAYRRGWLRQSRLPKPVVSVGNLTVGGTGKTPLVIWLARFLHGEGRKVGILSRGYGRKLPSENLIVSDGKELKTTWQLAGDEPFLIAQKCPWAVVAVGPNRYELGCWVNSRIPCDCFILDDGYQHLQLHRDVNFVLLDLKDPDGVKGCLPAGRLREPLSAVKDATFIVLTRSAGLESSSPIIPELEKAVQAAITPLRLTTRLVSCRHLSTGVCRPLTDFQHKKILVFSGIGNNQAFLEDLLACGLKIMEEIRFQDHFVYSPKEVDRIRRNLREHQFDMALTTEKDAVKIQEWITPDDLIAAVEMDMEWAQGKDEVIKVLDRLWVGPAACEMSRGK